MKLVFRQGDKAHNWYAVVNGSLDVQVISTKSKVKINNNLYSDIISVSSFHETIKRHVDFIWWYLWSIDQQVSLRDINNDNKQV